MSLKEKLAGVELNDDVVVEFSYEQGTDVFHYNETHVETAFENTDVVERVASVATSGLQVLTTYGDSAIQVLRDADLLDAYERGSYAFEDYVAAAIRDNFYEAELIEEVTERYDHKRGFTTLSASFQAPASVVLGQADDYSTVFSGWTAKVEHNGGTFSFDV